MKSKFSKTISPVTLIENGTTGAAAYHTGPAAVENIDFFFHFPGISAPLKKVRQIFPPPTFTSCVVPPMCSRLPPRSGRNLLLSCETLRWHSSPLHRRSVPAGTGKEKGPRQASGTGFADDNFFFLLLAFQKIEAIFHTKLAHTRRVSVGVDNRVPHRMRQSVLWPSRMFFLSSREPISREKSVRRQNLLLFAAHRRR